MKSDTEGKCKGKLKKRVKTKKTSIGRGVFARQDFAAHDVIGEVTGDIMGTDFESNYCMDLGGNAILEPAKPFRFLNHSCDPNCQLMLWKSQKIDGRKIRRLWLGAARDVVAGEELTIDYAWPLDAAIRCQCGAESCRGWVVDEREVRSLQRLSWRRRAAKMMGAPRSKRIHQPLESCSW